MDGRRGQEGGGWRVGRCIAVELDVALSLVTGYFVVAGVGEEFGELLSPLAEDWKVEAREILGREQRIVSLLELGTLCSATTFESDYVRALLPLRSLDPVRAVAALSSQARRKGSGARASDGGAQADALPPEAEPSNGRDDREATVRRLAELLVERSVSGYRAAGLAIDRDGAQGAAIRSEAMRLGRILEGGDLHERFWHWLDRFYYEWYQPWRRKREKVMEEAERRAALALGSIEAERGRPPLDWLPPQNPVKLLPELRSAIEKGGVRVCFWADPFGFADVSIIRTDTICLSFGEPGRIYAEFRRHAEEIALRAKALGDPTRLLILRLVRHFSAMNTELAEYLDIARPTASIHAKILREAGLIESRQDGHAVRHSIHRGELRKLFEDLYRFLDLGPFEASEGSTDGPVPGGSCA